MFGWSDRPTNVEVNHFIDGDNPAALFKVGQYEIKVSGAGIAPGADLSVSYTVPYHSRHDYNAKSAFPNMEVRDGEMRLPLEDIVDAILARVAPAEIAVALWKDDDVRAAFVDAMVSRWSEMNVGDPDRRKFLHGVKEAVHSAAIDRFANGASKLEYGFGRKWFFYHEVSRINDWLREGGYQDRDGNTLQLRHEDSDGQFKISGAVWNESRDHWREEALRLFPMPEQPAEPAPEEEIA